MRAVRAGRRLLPPVLLPSLVAGLVLAGVPATQAADTADPGGPPGQTSPATTVVSGGVTTDLDAIIESLRAELGESSEAMLRAGADLRLAEAALPGARATATEARTLLVQAQRRQETAARLRGQAQVRLILSEQEAEASAAAVAEQHARLGQLARAVYQGGGSVSDLSVLLEARSPSDFAERLVSLQTLASSQRSVLDDLEQVEQSFGSQTQDLEQVRDTLAAADEQAQRELAAVMTLEAQARAAEETVGRLVAARQAALAAAAAAQLIDDAAAQRRDTVSSQLELELAARARAEAGRGGSVDGSTVPAQPAALSWPIVGRLSSPFGMRVHPVTGVYKLHTGQDLGAPCGTPIRAARDGVVIDAGWNSAYGWRTVISHGAVGGVLLTTTYNHQQAVDVAVGERIGLGQVIGSVGTTGYSTGCHLHFELYVNARLVDPVPWLS